jgi:hypothetical protein
MLILKNIPLVKRPVDSWVSCGEREIIYSISGGINAESTVDIDDDRAKQLSYTRLKAFAKEYEVVGKLLANIANKEDVSENERTMNRYLYPKVDYVNADAYLGGGGYITVSSDDNTWYLPMSAMKLFSVKYRQALNDCRSVRDTFSVPELDRLNNIDLQK